LGVFDTIGQKVTDGNNAGAFDVRHPVNSATSTTKSNNANPDSVYRITAKSHHRFSLSRTDSIFLCIFAFNCALFRAANNSGGSNGKTTHNRFFDKISTCV